jgi:uncharacterized SAM-binding protein YcdF (DUF218 family)
MTKFTLILFLTAVLLSLIPGCSLDSRVTKSNKRYLAQAPFDAIIVPGYPFRLEKNKILFAVRVNFAKELFDKGIAKNIIFSGAAVQTPYIEGKIMKIIADSLGLPQEHTFVEDKALHSNQNAILGTKMARKMGFKKIAIATDPYQFSYMTLLLKLFEPKTAILTFYPNQMPQYDKPLPMIDTSAVFIKHFVSPLN